MPLVVALVAGAAASVVLLVRSPGAARSPLAGEHPSTARYGGIPGWLPRAKVPVNRVVTASAAHPWLAIEGDTVIVRLAAGTVRATAVGPQVPEEGAFPVPKTSPCTFLVTFAAPAGAVPLAARAFTIRDELGALHDPRVTLAGGGALPARLAPGRTVTVRLHDVLPTGSGTLRWAPGGGPAIVSWDFDVEID